MTKALTIIILLICTTSIQAQTDNIDQKLLVKYSKKELAVLKKEKPTEYEFAKYCIDHAFYIGKGSKEKIAASPTEYGTIKIKNLSDVNFFELNIELKQSDFQAFVINGTSKVIMIKSRDRILKELKTK